MALTLDVDGKKTEDPSMTDIVYAFESLDKGSGFFSGPGISIVILARDETHHLTASGTHTTGFMLSYQDGDSAYEYNSDPNQAVSVGNIIKIFQTYARGEDWSQSKFKWERFDLGGKDLRHH